VYDSVVREVTRDIDEDVRDRVRALANTEAFQQSRRERKKIEMRFAHMKRIFRLDRLRLRGLSGARDEVLLTATAQNLRRLVKFPATAICGAGLSRMAGASGVGASMPRLPMGTAQQSSAKIYKRHPRQIHRSFAIQSVQEQTSRGHFGMSLIGRRAGSKTIASTMARGQARHLNLRGSLAFTGHKDVGSVLWP
jgi:hypothetical protein